MEQVIRRWRPEVTKEILQKAGYPGSSSNSPGAPPPLVEVPATAAAAPHPESVLPFSVAGVEGAEALLDSPPSRLPSPTGRPPPANYSVEALENVPDTLPPARSRATSPSLEVAQLIEADSATVSSLEVVLPSATATPVPPAVVSRLATNLAAPKVFLPAPALVSSAAASRDSSPAPASTA